MERTEVSSGPWPKVAAVSPSTLSHVNGPFAGTLLIPCPVTAVPSRVSRFFTPCQESNPVCWLCLPHLWEQHSDMPGSQEFMDLIQQPEPLTPQHPDKMNTALLWCLQGMEVELCVKRDSGPRHRHHDRPSCFLTSCLCLIDKELGPGSPQLSWK